MHSLQSDVTPLDRPENDGLGLLIVGVVVALAALAAVPAVPRFALPYGAVLPLVVGAFGLALVVRAAFASERRRRRLVARLIDVSDANRTLHERAVRKDEFLASVSHELRTPLNVVLGYVDLLLDDSFGALEIGQRDILHRITKNASNLSQLINDLVDLSRIEAHRMRIEMEPVDVASLFADLRAVMEVLLAGRDVAFRSTIAAGCDRVDADPDRLKQIVSNLLVNAVKFTERGRIDLAAVSVADGVVEISVTDTGIGIPSAQHRAIFEPFRQVHDRARRTPGAGLGLSIASRLATLMKGSLRVSSTPGEGSCFTLTVRAAGSNVTPGAVPLRHVS
jgi:signal transduction histidine kinase